MTKKKRPYYTLLLREKNGLWYPEFGDYDRKVVFQEMQDTMNSGSFVRGTKCKIILTSDAQADVLAGVMHENTQLMLKETINGN